MKANYLALSTILLACFAISSSVNGPVGAVVGSSGSSQMNSGSKKISAPPSRKAPPKKRQISSGRTNSTTPLQKMANGAVSVGRTLIGKAAQAYLASEGIM